jgi:hypothetical protein
LVRIAISQAAFDAIAKTLPLGSVGFENKVNEKGERLMDPASSTGCGPWAARARAKRRHIEAGGGGLGRPRSRQDGLDDDQRARLRQFEHGDPAGEGNLEHARLVLEGNRLTPASIADHDPPHKGDWNAFRLGPLQSLCRDCHQGKWAMTCAATALRSATTAFRSICVTHSTLFKAWLCFSALVASRRYPRTRSNADEVN